MNTMRMATLPIPHDWSDVAELNYANPQLRRYMTDMLKYWIREFDLDGFRCDVAEEVPTDFWENARAELDKIKPDIVMLAEGHKAELLLKAFDFDYSWPLHSALTNVLQGRGRASDLRSEWDKEFKGVAAWLAAHALLRQSRRASRHRAFRRTRRAGGISVDVHARWRAAACITEWKLETRPNRARRRCLRSCRSSGPSPNGGRSFRDSTNR